MPKVPVLRVILPDGAVVTCATRRTYTHVVVLSLPGQAPDVLAWCDSYVRALRQLVYWTARGGRRLDGCVPGVPEVSGLAWQVAVVPVRADRPSGPVVQAPGGDDGNPRYLPL